MAAGAASQRSAFLVLLCWGGSLLLIQYIGTAVLDGVFCCLGLVWFEASPMVQLLQIFLQPNENDPVLSGCTCLELAPGVVAQKWMNVSYLAAAALTLLALALFFFFLFCSHMFLSDLRAVLVGIQRPCAVGCVASSMNWWIKRLLLFRQFCSLCLF